MTLDTLIECLECGQRHGLTFGPNCPAINGAINELKRLRDIERRLTVKPRKSPASNQSQFAFNTETAE